MIFGKSKLELKVGIFIFIGIVILVVFVLFIGNIKTWTQGYRLNFIFNFVNGVKIGAPVRFAGVDAGEVKAIKFVFVPEKNKTEVRITGWLRKEAQVPIDSAVWVNTLGLLGEKYIEIMPGKNYEEFFQENDCMVGNDPVAMHEMGEIAKNLVDHIDETVGKINKGQGTVGKLFSDDTIYKELEALVSDIRKNPWKLFWKTKEKK